MIINRQLLIYLTIGFIVATVIGTLTHELGHYIVAKSFGYEAEINYGYTSWTNSNTNQAASLSDNFWVILGGPLVTILIGTIGLSLIFLFKKSFYITHRLSFGQWVLIFVSLFWLRQTFNLIVWFGSHIFNGQFSSRLDEIHLANYLEIPNWTISSFTATIGAIILTIIIFKFIPVQQRFTFITSGIVGGVTGYFLWLHLLGPILIP